MNHKEIVHFFLKSRIHKSARILDMTCGNGHDTLFLGQLAKEVYAIDIQKDAIESAKKRCSNLSNVKYYHMDHSKINFDETIDGAVYNLGYLPSGDKSIITSVDTTLHSLDLLMNKKIKYLSIATYPGHDGGLEESNAVKHYLDQNLIKYIELTYEKPGSPVTFLIDFVNPLSSTIIIDDLRNLSAEQAWKKIQSILHSF